MAWIHACNTSQIPPQGGFLVERQPEPIGVFSCGGILRAASATCPHAKALLTGGSVEGDVVTCPKHHWKWNLAQGKAVDNAGYAIAVYPVKVEDGKVMVDLP